MSGQPPLPVPPRRWVAVDLVLGGMLAIVLVGLVLTLAGVLHPSAQVRQNVLLVLVAAALVWIALTMRDLLRARRQLERWIAAMEAAAEADADVQRRLGEEPPA